MSSGVNGLGILMAIVFGTVIVGGLRWLLNKGFDKMGFKDKK